MIFEKTVVPRGCRNDVCYLYEAISHQALLILPFSPGPCFPSSTATTLSQVRQIWDGPPTSTPASTHAVHSTQIKINKLFPVCLQHSLLKMKLFFSSSNREFLYIVGLEFKAFSTVPFTYSPKSSPHFSPKGFGLSVPFPLPGASISFQWPT